MIAVSLLLLVLAILGAPLFAIIATSAMFGFHSSDTELMTIALELMSIAQMPILTAIPLFTFAGYILSESQAPQRLVRLTNAMFGAWRRARFSRRSRARLASRSLRSARSSIRHLSRMGTVTASTWGWSPRREASGCCSRRHFR